MVDLKILNDNDVISTMIFKQLHTDGTCSCLLDFSYYKQGCKYYKYVFSHVSLLDTCL